MTQTHVARQIGVSVIHCLSSTFVQTNCEADRPFTRRPQYTVPAVDHYLRTCALRSRVTNGAQLRACLFQAGTRVSTQNVRNRLHTSELRAIQPYVGFVTLYSNQTIKSCNFVKKKREDQSTLTLIMKATIDAIKSNKASL